MPVLLGPAIEGLNIQPGGCYMDGTFGRGGHSREIVRHLNTEGRLIAIDRDPEAIAAADPALKQDPRVELVKGEIAEIREIAAGRGVLGNVDGLLFDLGVSSPQLDSAERGFSFSHDGPLDMRMDPTSGISAAEWLASVDEKGLKQVLFRFGEERYAGRIAKAILARRAEQPIRRTAELAEIVASAVPARGQRKHPATKTFQAVRIHVNHELEQLDQALAASVDVLRRHGRLCVISFHSLEDRRVKRFMRNASREAEAWRGMPSVPEEARPPLAIVGKAVQPAPEEAAGNPRARSARLRVAERL